MRPPTPAQPAQPAARSRSVLALTGALLALLTGTAGVVAGAVGIVPEVPATTTPTALPPAEQVTETVVESLGQLDNSELARAYGDSVFKVEVEGCGEAGSGSAWVLDEHHLVTNWHVISIDPHPTVVSRDGQTVLEGEVIGAEERPDIAVIRVEEALPTALPWAVTDDLTEGQDLVAIGYPAPAGDFSVIPSTIVSFQVQDGVREAIRSDGATDFGNSGGPAITREGQVAGVVTEMLVDPTQLQMVAILFTADALQPTVDEFLADPTTVAADCDYAPPVVPDGWVEDWDDDWWDDDWWDDEEWASGGGGEPDAVSYGDDAAMDALWDACADGDLVACDDLWWESPWDSEYEAFGSTCGDRSADTYGGCVLEAGREEAEESARAEQDAYEQEQREADAEAQAVLDALVASCEGGDMAACDDLYLESPWGSAEEEVAESCGGHYPDGWALCVDRAAEAAELAELVDQCQDGDMQACDDLYWASPVGSPEEEVAEDCGGRYPGEGGWCTWAEEEDTP